MKRCKICGQPSEKGAAFEQHMIDHWGSAAPATPETSKPTELDTDTSTTLF